jgi:hypothetical protein
MIIRSIDGEGDWNFGKGLSSYAQAEQAIEENVKTRVLSWVGDCFFSLTDYIDWKSRLDVGQFNNLNTEIRSVILNSFGVVGATLVSGNFNSSNRNYAITFTMDTIYGKGFLMSIQQTLGV